MEHDFAYRLAGMIKEMSLSEPRKIWLELYLALRGLMEPFGIESPYGWESKYGSGDYWIVDDFNEEYHKIYIWKWESFRYEIVYKIHDLIVERFRFCTVVIAFDTADMNEATPLTGITINLDSINSNIDNDWVPDFIRNMEY